MRKQSVHRNDIKWNVINCASTSRDKTVKIKDASYYPLTQGLIERITDDQLDNIKNKNNIILFKDLANCFTYRSSLAHGDSACVCTKKIKNVYRIENKETKDEHDVGSECISNWDLSNLQFSNMKLDQTKIYNDKHNIKEDIKLCSFCNKNNSKMRCRKCPPKLLCSSVFLHWKQQTKNFKDIKENVVNHWKRISSQKMQSLKKAIYQWYLSRKMKKQIQHTTKIEDDSQLLLYVPYEEKHIAKKRGAKWDETCKKWYVDVEYKNDSLDEYALVYLSVPFAQKQIAKDNNCKWCSEKKKWYCNNKMLNKSKTLQQWI